MDTGKASAALSSKPAPAGAGSPAAASASTPPLATVPPWRAGGETAPANAPAKDANPWSASARLPGA